MTYYLCKYCGIITNTPPDGDCELSPEGTHKWVCGSSVDEFMLKNWKSPEGAYAGIDSSSPMEQGNLN